MVEDDILCINKVIKSIVKDTDFASAWKVIEKHMENIANRIRACRKNAETDDEEISYVFELKSFYNETEIQFFVLLFCGYRCVLYHFHIIADILNNFLETVRNVS